MDPSSNIPICSPVSLPLDLTIVAAEVARRINPVNAPLVHPEAVFPEWGLPNPQHLALLTSAYWGAKGVHLTVGFMDTPEPGLAERIVAHANAWGKTANVVFSLSNVDPMVRVARDQMEYYSYLGTGILSIPKSEHTMMLGGFTMRTRDEEFFRVVRHEFGHTLAFPHEHMRKEFVDRMNIIRTNQYYWRTQGWDVATVRSQVLTALDPTSIRGSTPDGNSIMAYQVPAECTNDGQPIPGGFDIDQIDYDFAASVYPKGSIAPMTPDEVFRLVEGAF